MDFWNIMTTKDDYLCSFVNCMIKLKNKFNFRQTRLLNEVKRKYDFGKDDLFIVLNGPSINKQDFELFRNKQTMFVNRGFKHPKYKEIAPKFHVFVDRKMLTGEWPVSWLDEIVEMNPNVIFVMPITWAFNKIFKPYIDKGYNFYWISFDTPASCLGVAGYCFKFALAHKFRKIYFTGFDATGLASEVLHTTSHFYGKNEENDLKTTLDFKRDFYMFSRHLSDLNALAKKVKKEGRHIINITDGGLLDMFPRANFDDVLKNA